MGDLDDSSESETSTDDSSSASSSSSGGDDTSSSAASSDDSGSSAASSDASSGSPASSDDSGSSAASSDDSSGSPASSDDSSGSPASSDDSSSSPASSDDSGSSAASSDDSSSSPASNDDSSSSSSSGGDDSGGAQTAAVLPTLYATIDIDPYEGAEQHPNSIQVSTDVSLKLSWTTTGASSVTISGLGEGLEPNGQRSIPTSVASYILVAIGDAGTYSVPYPISVDTHDPDEVVSPHAFVSPGDEDEDEDGDGESSEDGEDGSGDGEEDKPALGGSIALELKKQFDVTGAEGVSIGSYAKLAIKLGIISSGKFEVEGDISPEMTASVTAGFSEKLSASVASGTLSMSGEPTFELTAEASVEAAEIACKISFDTGWDFCGELAGEIKFSAFEFEIKAGKREVKLANVAVTLSGTASYPAEGAGSEVELGGTSGALTVEVELAIEASISPSWGELAEKLGEILLEKFGELMAFTTFELVGAPLVIIVEYWAIVIEINVDMLAEILDFMQITQKVDEVNAAFATSYAAAVIGGDAPDGGSDVAEKAATQGHLAGAQARGSMVSQFRDRPDVKAWLVENYDGRPADSDDDEVEKQLDAQVEQNFNEQYTALQGQIVSRVTATHLNASKQAVWNDFVGKYGNLRGDAIKLFGNWWMGSTDEGALTVLCSRTSDDSRKVPKAQWLAIPAGMRARFCQLLNVSDPWSDDAPAPKAGPEASEQTVNKVWSWLQSHTQSSAADFPNYDDGETHLNSDQISTLNMKLSAQNAGQ